jgi:hypothetical protein
MQFYPINLSKTFSISSLWTISIFMAISQSAVKANPAYSFACNHIRISQKLIPITVILLPNGKYSEIIRWDSKMIPDREREGKCRKAF